jgi:hypothetical protein
MGHCGSKRVGSFDVGRVGFVAGSTRLGKICNVFCKIPS